MATFAAVTACLILAGLAAFQIALASGAPFGRFAWGGSHDVLPGRLRVSSAVSVVVYAVFTLIILQAAGLVGGPGSDAASGGSIWFLTGYFTIGVLMNGISRSKPERAVMTPVALVLAVLCLVIASR